MKIADDARVLSFLFLLALTTVLATGLLDADDITEQREALVALYQSTGGNESWTNEDGWLNGTDVCTWFGVSCSVGGQLVTDIVLDSNGLVGKIPTELGNLQSLTNIHLRGNDLIGTIPTELGNLQSITRLRLSLNRLTGNIPTELGNSQTLVFLYLEDNDLIGTIPTEIGNLQSLNDLWLHFNKLTGSIPTEFGNLQSLESLWLFNNTLVGNIPTEFGNLLSLDSLWMFNNDLTGIIPTEFGNLQSLIFAYLENNDFSGTIPTELGNLESLDSLWLNFNSLTGTIPTEFGDLQSLSVLDLNTNALVGTIPIEFGTLQNIAFLDFSNNALVGNIPTEIGNSQNLDSLFLENNNLTGNIPTEFGNLKNLTFFWLFNNIVVGNVSTELCSVDGIDIKVDCLEVKCSCCEDEFNEECPAPDDPINPFCFAGSTHVTTKDKGRVTMEQLVLGDEIMTISGKYERVYSFGHRDCVRTAEFLQFQPSKLEITADHMLFVQSGKALPAGAVKVGDVMSDGSTVTGIQPVVRKGMYAPFTSSGTLVVNGLHVSSYVAFQDSEVLRIGRFSTGLSYQWIAHKFMTPQRLWCKYSGPCLEEHYNEVGISKWVEAPLDMAQWFLAQNEFVMFMLVIPLMLMFGVLWLIEIVGSYPVVVLTTIFTLAMMGKKKFSVKFL